MKAWPKRFVKMMFPGISSPGQQKQLINTTELLISFRLIDDCSKLMLDKFQDCLFENDLSVLIISGSPTQEDLQAAWDKIYVQYCQLSQDSSYNEVLDRKSTRLNSSHANISYAVFCLKN